MSFRLRSGLCAAASLAAMSGGAAVAQQAPAQGQPAQGQNAVPEIIVTAQLREQKLIDVPITVTAFTGARLDALGIQDLHTLSLQTPGFYFENHSIDFAPVVMRGISDTNTDPTDEPRISIYQDGVSISQIVAANVELFDIQRVEVAEGPQTTLYGRSAETGAVNIIENKANEAGFDWSMHLEGGNYDYKLIEGMINQPLSDNFAIRIAAIDKYRDGYIPNDAGGPALNSVDTLAVRIATNYHANRVNDDFIVNYEGDRPSGTDYKSTTFEPNNPTTGQVLGNLSPYSATSQPGTPSIDNGADPLIRRMIVSTTNILTYQISDAFKLTSTSGYRHFRDYDIDDTDGFSFPILVALSTDTDTEFSQDFRLNYDAGGRLSAFAGLSAFSETGTGVTTEAYNEPLTLALLTGVLNRSNPNPGPVSAYTNSTLEAGELQAVAAEGGLNLPAAEALGIADNLSSDHVESGLTQSRTTAFDGYADATFHATSKLEFSAGIRFTNEEKTTKYAGYVLDRSVLGGVVGAEEEGKAAGLNAKTTGNCAVTAVLAANQLCQLLYGLAEPGAGTLAGPLPLFGLSEQPTPGNGSKQAAALADNGASWRATVRYKFTPDVDLYFEYARGLRPAVLSPDSPSTPEANTTFTVAPAETLDSYELGVKTRLLGGRLRVDSDIYYYNYNNFQTTVQVGTEFVTENAGNAQAYGFEGKVDWTPIDNLNLYTTYAYAHTEFLNGIYAGNTFELAPRNTVTIGGSYRIPALGGAFTLAPNYHWQSLVYFGEYDDNISELQGAAITPIQSDLDQKAYGVLNLRISYTPRIGNWTLTAFGDNLTNTQYVTQRGGTGTDLGIPTDIPGEPLMFGASFTIRR
jgi:outer membrane receptor protein involved in Fe transport